MNVKIKHNRSILIIMDYKLQLNEKVSSISNFKFKNRFFCLKSYSEVKVDKI